MSATPTKAEVNQGIGICHDGPLWVDGDARCVIIAPKLEPRIMRYKLTDPEWAAIKPRLPNKPRGVPRVNDRRVLNGIFWVLRSGAPWRDLPQEFGPYTTCYNRFVRWRKRLALLARGRGEPSRRDRLGDILSASASGSPKWRARSLYGDAGNGDRGVWALLSLPFFWLVRVGRWYPNQSHQCFPPRLERPVSVRTVRTVRINSTVLSPIGTVRRTVRILARRSRVPTAEAVGRVGIRVGP